MGLLLMPLKRWMLPLLLRRPMLLRLRMLPMLLLLPMLMHDA